MLELRERAMRESYRFGRIFASPEDAGQEYILRLLEGRHRHATVSQAMIDIARETADPRSPNFADRLNIATAVPVESKYLERPTTKLIDDVDTRLTIEFLLSTLNMQSQKVIELFLLGYNFGEISDNMGFTEARAHQIYHRAVAKMKKSLERTPMRNHTN